MEIRAIVIGGAAFTVFGCATEPTGSERADRAARVSETDCVRTSLITDWDDLDERNLIVWEGRRPYHVELAQACIGIDFANMIAFYDRSADQRICGFGLDRVIVDSAIPESCSVAAVDELTDEQAEEMQRRADEARSSR